MNIITDRYKPLILNILKENGLSEDNLIIDENPYLFARNMHWKDIKKRMIGYSTTTSSGKKIILIKKEITDADQEDVFQRIINKLDGGFDRGRKNFLKTPERFIEHLVRHEIAHCVSRKPQAQESEIDEEALRKMGFSETGTKF